MVGATRAYNKLSNASGVIQGPIGCLWGKALVDMVVPIQDHFDIIVI